MQVAAHASRAAAAPLDVALAARRAVADFRAAHPEVVVVVEAPSEDLWAPIAAEDFASALGVLLDNAAFASKKVGSTAPIDVRVSASEDRVRVAVEDAGTGVPEEVIERVGEPFLTTKEPGEGMGLGLYLARGLLDPIGGTLTIENRRPRESAGGGAPVSATYGARAVLDLPRVSAPAEVEWAHAAE